MRTVMGYRSWVIGHRLWVMGLIILLSFAQMGCAAQAVSQGPQNLREQKEQNDPYAWDFGRVKEGEVLKHSFVLKNESPKVLNIKDVNTSCGCTVSKIDKKSVLPTETTLIEVQFNSKGYSGAVQQYIYVNTDNLDNPVLRYIIKAEVVK